MGIDIGPAVREWAQTHPETVNYLNELVRRRIRASVGSSVSSAWIASARGVQPPRLADDLDLFAPPSEFDKAVMLMPNRKMICGKVVAHHAGDGAILRLPCDEAIGRTEEGTIQLLRPCGPMRRGLRKYATHDSDLAASNIQVIETDQGLVPARHPFGTVALYSLLQRAGNKNDAWHVANMLHACDPVHGTYEQARAREIGLDMRAARFIALAAVGTTLPQVRPQLVPAMA